VFFVLALAADFAIGFATEGPVTEALGLDIGILPNGLAGMGI